MRIIAIIKRISQEMFRDKRTLALLFAAPLLILTLMYYLFNGDSPDPILGVAQIEDNLITQLTEANIDIEKLQTITDSAETTIIDKGLDGLLAKKNGITQLTLKNSDPAAAQALEMKVNQAISALVLTELIRSSEAANLNVLDQEGIATNYLYGSHKTNFFDILSPILIGFFVFFFVFLISGIGLLKERTSGTLDRLMATPVRRWEIVVAYLTGFGLFAIAQTFIVVIYSISVLNVVLVGSFFNVVLINLLLALVALSLGTLLSTFAASEFQMVQFIPLVVIPQFFFSGIIPLEGMASWLQVLAKIMPIYYGADALKAIMYEGQQLIAVTTNIIALTLFATIFITLNIVALKKYRPQ